MLEFVFSFNFCLTVCLILRWHNLENLFIIYMFKSYLTESPFYKISALVLQKLKLLLKSRDIWVPCSEQNISIQISSQITSLPIVYSTVCSGTDQRKGQSSASLAFVRGIQRWLVNSPHMSLRTELTHWGRDKMAAIFQTTISNAFPWMKTYEFRFHWKLFLWVQLTISLHWFR